MLGTVLNDNRHPQVTVKGPLISRMLTVSYLGFVGGLEDLGVRGFRA